MIQFHVYNSPEPPDHIPIQNKWLHTLTPQLPKLSVVNIWTLGGILGYTLRDATVRTPALAKLCTVPDSRLIIVKMYTVHRQQIENDHMYTPHIQYAGNVQGAEGNVYNSWFVYTWGSHTV
jgi:hypothetical protein